MGNLQKQQKRKPKKHQNSPQNECWAHLWKYSKELQKWIFIPFEGGSE